MKALILVADEFEELSLFLPWYRLREENLEVRLAGPMMHAMTGLHGYSIEPDLRIHEVNPAEFELLIIPDGPAVERLRLREEAVDVTRTFMQDGYSRVAAIGHGPQLLISAGVLDGRTVTCTRASATTSVRRARTTATRRSSATTTCSPLADLTTFPPSADGSCRRSRPRRCDSGEARRIMTRASRFLLASRPRDSETGVRRAG